MLTGQTAMKRAQHHQRFTRLAGLTVLVALAGCKIPGGGSGTATFRQKDGDQSTVLYVRCLYDQRPWLNLDAAGDRDPEGIHYRVFLDPGTGKCIHAAGTFHIEMYRIERISPTKVERTLVSDWHYPTSDVPTIAKPGMLGNGYHLHLRWADKDTAGHEVEFITRFEDASGHSTATAMSTVPSVGVNR